MRTLPLIVALLMTSTSLAQDTLRVMSFNLWHGGDAGGQPLSQTAKVIAEAGADIVGLQETAGQAPKGQQRPDRARELAEMLGWHFLDQGNRTAIISRFKVESATPNKLGATIALAGGRKVHLFNVHLAHAPYQPYQLLGIPYENGKMIKTAAEAVEQAQAARGKQIAALLDEIKPLAKREIVFVTGDFNEPSHLDWTADAARAGKCPLAVEWPATKSLADAGFIDALRAVRPDVLKDRAHTWTPTTRADDPGDRHDRIDIVLARGPVKVRSVKIVGEARESADIVVRPYPSDHRAVVAEIAWAD